VRFEHRVDSGHQILVVAAAPVVDRAVRKLLAVSRTAARIHRQHSVATPRVKLRWSIEAIAELAVGSSVNGQDHGRAAGGIKGWVEPALDVGSVEALELYFLRL
jgi:hypothetical protein